MTSAPKTLSGMRVKVLSDWNAEFPDLVAYRPLWLGRIVGPLFQGINLYRNSAYDSYVPFPHVHCLCRTDWDEPALNPGDRVREPRSHADFWIRAGLHEEEYKIAAQSVRDQTLVPLDGPVTLDQVVHAYRWFIMSRDVWRWLESLREDLASIFAYYGRMEDATAVLCDAAADMRTWPDLRGLPDEDPQFWLEQQTARINDVEGLHCTVEENIVKMKMQKLPRQDLIH